MKFKLVHSYSCGHSRTYWAVRKRRAVTHEERCASCVLIQARDAERTNRRLGVLAVRLSNTLTNVQLVIAQGNGLASYRVSRGRE